jgi:hypothetical protein
MHRINIDEEKLQELQQLDEARNKQDWEKVWDILSSSLIPTQIYYINSQLDFVMSMSGASQGVNDVVDLIKAACELSVNDAVDLKQAAFKPSHLNLRLFTRISKVMIIDFSENLMWEDFDTYWHDPIQLEQLLSNSFLCLTNEDQNAFKQHCQSKLYSAIQTQVDYLKTVTNSILAREKTKIEMLEGKDEISIRLRDDELAFSDPSRQYSLLNDALAAESSDSPRKERKNKKVHKEGESSRCRNALTSISAMKALRKCDDIIFKYYPLQEASQIEELRINRYNMDRTIDWYGRTACELFTKHLDDVVLHLENHLYLYAPISIINEEDKAKKAVFSKILGELSKQLKGDFKHPDIHMFDNITSMLNILKNAYNENKSQNNLKTAKSIYKLLSTFSSYYVCTLNEEENGPLDYSFDKCFISFKEFVMQHEKQAASLKL